MLRCRNALLTRWFSSLATLKKMSRHRDTSFAKTSQFVISFEIILINKLTCLSSFCISSGCTVHVLASFMYCLVVLMIFITWISVIMLILNGIYSLSMLFWHRQGRLICSRYCIYNAEGFLGDFWWTCMW